VNYRRASLAYRQNDFERAHRLCAAAAERLQGEELLLALNLLADVHMKQGQLDEAEHYLLQAQALCERLQNKAYMAVVEGQFGRLYLGKQELEQAAWHRERSLAQFRQMGDRKNEAYALYDLSLIAEQEADYARGLDLAGKSLEIFTLVGDTFNVMNTLLHRGDLYRAQDEKARAEKSWCRALELAQSLGNTRFAEALQQRLEQLR
jgi:tetratricopeptide (TPR) repeat protein